MMQKKKVFLGFPHGMCAGVRRALKTVETVLDRFGAPVYVLHEIVHNNFIVNELKKRGVHFADSLDEIPPESVLLFSAHGVSAAVEEEARRRKLRIIDVTCPLVKRLHHAAAKPRDVLILIGHRGHPEVVGTVGRSGPQEERPIQSSGLSRSSATASSFCCKSHCFIISDWSSSLVQRQLVSS